MEILDEEIEISEGSPEEEEWRLFIGDKADYYIPIWNKFKQQDKRVHFNISAMFFNIYWLGYRKMYKLAFLVLLASYLLVAVLFYNIRNIQGDNFAFYTFTYYFVYIGLALGGDWMYYKHAQEVIQEIKRKTPNKSAREKAIQAAGGVNPMFSILLMGVSTALVLFFVLVLNYFLII